MRYIIIPPPQSGYYLQGNKKFGAKMTFCCDCWEWEFLEVSCFQDIKPSEEIYARKGLGVVMRIRILLFNLKYKFKKGKPLYSESHSDFIDNEND